MVYLRENIGTAASNPQLHYLFGNRAKSSAGLHAGYPFRYVLKLTENRLTLKIAEESIAREVGWFKYWKNLGSKFKYQLTAINC